MVPKKKTTKETSRTTEKKIATLKKAKNTVEPASMKAALPKMAAKSEIKFNDK